MAKRRNRIDSLVWESGKKTPHNFSAGNVEDHRDVSTLLGSVKRKAHKSKTELWGTVISLSREDGREPGFEKAQKR